MENTKPFFKRASFYLAAVAFLFTLVALAVYASNCATDLNDNKVSATVVAFDVIAMLVLAAAVAGEVLKQFFGEDTLVGKIVKYASIAEYAAFILLTLSFFMCIRDEYSLLGATVYPLITGTEAGSTDETATTCCFVALGFTFVALVVAAVAALLQAKGKAHRYLTVSVFVFVIAALALYAGNCASEFNGDKVSSAVVAWDVIAIISLVLAIAGDVLSHFFGTDTLIGKICEYIRLFKYVAFVSLIVSFFMCILDEYSLLGTILYPIVSGTVGDPVDDLLAASYFMGLGLTLVSLVMSIVAALLNKRAVRLAHVQAKEEVAA